MCTPRVPLLSLGVHSSYQRFDMRDYKKEYRDYHSKPTQIKRRSKRNSARRLMIAKRGVAAVDGKDVAHKDRNPMNNSEGNLRLQRPGVNRGRNSR